MVLQMIKALLIADKNDILTFVFLFFHIIAGLSKDHFSTAPLWFFLRFLQFFSAKIIFGAAFPIWCEGWRTEDEAHCTESKAHPEIGDYTDARASLAPPAG